MKDCTQCGKCCIKYGNGALYASQEEIDQWELFEPEITGSAARQNFDKFISSTIDLHSDY